MRTNCPSAGVDSGTAVALAAALAMLAVASLAVWEAVSATGWVPGIL